MRYGPAQQRQHEKVPPRLYTNVVALRVGEPPERKAAHELHAEASAERAAELRLKRKLDQADVLLNRLEELDATLAAEIASLERTRKHKAARRGRIEERALEEMEAAGLGQALGIRSTWRAQQAGVAALVVNDEQKVPRQFMKTPKPGKSIPDKLAIKNALDANRELDPADWGCALGVKTSLIRT
jgi:hypothetical protein